MYDTAIILWSLWQARHVSRMTIETLSVEGDTSVKTLLLAVVLIVCSIGIRLILVEAIANHWEAIIFRILESMSFCILILSMMLPKVGYG